ncbi:MAG: tetratricopeptide repeat protein [Deltaproteobacteria bacterium]|nr:tetratricopeptide repeat protein [Deltaproteobacteria bacterium]
MYCHSSIRFLVGITFFSFLIAIIWGGTALAQDTAMRDAAAREAYADAKNLFENEKYEDAASRFREAYALKPSWKILYNIGQCEAAAKNHGLALEAFERYLSEGGDDIFTERREKVISEVDRLRRMVGYVQVKAPDGTIIFINDIERGTSPILMGLPVSAGVQHKIRGTWNNEELPAQNFRVTGAQTVVVEFSSPTENTDASDETIVQPVIPVDTSVEKDPPTAAPPEESMTTAKSDKFRKMRLVGWILTGVGAGTLIGGGVLGGMAISKNNDLKKECGNDPCPEKANDVDSNIKMANASTGLLIGGGVVAAAGTALLIVGIKKEKQLANSFTFLPAVSTHVVGAGLEWRF